MPVTDDLLERPAEHSWQHHAKCHEAGANCVMRGLVLSFRHQDHEQHICRKAKPVPELLECHCRIDQNEIVRLDL